MTNYEQLLNCNAKAELARRNFLDFVIYNRPNYAANWHHKLLCNYLQKFINGEIKRLMIFMPPQHGKSELVSRNLPAYILGKNPDAKIVLASYSSMLASSFNRDCQRIIDNQTYKDIFPDTFLNRTNVVSVSSNYLRNSEIFEVVNYTGFLKTVGVGGSLTGTRADYAIIDDPVKDSIEAMSPTYQQRNWNWYNDVLYTRIHNNSSILITQTRWDVNDLAGMLLKNMESGAGEKWVILSLPAIKTDNRNEYDIREIGDALWPDMHDIVKLQHVRTQSLRTFEALYQQNPRPIQSGGEFWNSFNILKHVAPVIMKKGPVHISLDNNVIPYVTISAWQILDKQITQVHEIPACDPNNNAVKAARLLVKWLDSIEYDEVLFVYGDPSASARSTVDENSRSFYDKFYEVLRTAGYKVVSRVAKSHPAISMSASFINDIYESNLYGWSILINEKCPVSIEDYYSVKVDSEGRMIKIKRKDLATNVSFEPHGHFSDAKRYFIIKVLEREFILYKSKNRKAGSYSGQKN